MLLLIGDTHVTFVDIRNDSQWRIGVEHGSCVRMPQVLCAACKASGVTQMKHITMVLVIYWLADMIKDYIIMRLAVRAERSRHRRGATR